MKCWQTPSRQQMQWLDAKKDVCPVSSSWNRVSQSILRSRKVVFPELPMFTRDFWARSTGLSFGFYPQREVSREIFKYTWSTFLNWYTPVSPKMFYSTSLKLPREPLLPKLNTHQAVPSLKQDPYRQNPTCPQGFFFFNLFIFNWRIIDVQYCVGFYHTSTWISHEYIHVPSVLNVVPKSHPILPPRSSQGLLLHLHTQPWTMPQTSGFSYFQK